MKIGRIRVGQEVHLGAVVYLEGEPHCLDLTSFGSKQQRERDPMLDSMAGFIAAGTAALERAAELMVEAERASNPDVLVPIRKATWLAPVESPRNFLCAGRNFNSHHKESAEGWSKEGIKIDRSSFPTGFVKLPGTIVGDGESVPFPEAVTELDYEIEVAAVLGASAHAISVDEALGHVFGYTVFIDLSARDWQRQEMRSQMLLLGKNFPSFGPLGPWILTADEVPDPGALHLELRVNGELRQSAPASDMIFSFPQLISFWSQVGLVAGDLIASGTPEGVAMHHAGDDSWYLKPRDAVVGTVAQIGDLSITIV